MRPLVRLSFPRKRALGRPRGIKQTCPAPSTIRIRAYNGLTFRCGPSSHIASGRLFWLVAYPDLGAAHDRPKMAAAPRRSKPRSASGRGSPRKSAEPTHAPGNNSRDARSGWGIDCNFAELVRPCACLRPAGRRLFHWRPRTTFQRETGGTRFRRHSLVRCLRAKTRFGPRPPCQIIRGVDKDVRHYRLRATSSGVRRGGSLPHDPNPAAPGAG